MLSIAESRLLGPILQQIVQGVAEASNLALARLWLIQPDSECPVCANTGSGNRGLSLHLRGSAGTTLEGRQEYTRVEGAFHRIEIGQRKIGRIAESGKPMLIPVVTGAEPWVADPEWIRQEQVQSFAGQPLIFRGEVQGVLAVFSRSPFSSDEFAWLRTFADHAAVAIGN